MRNHHGVVETATVIVIAVVTFLLAPMVLKNGNPFDRSADPSNRRTASAISGKDIVEITNVVAASEHPVTVKVDRSVEASKEITDPKLTLGQKVGRFFAGLGTWTLILLIVGAVFCFVTPVGAALWSRWKYRHAFKNTVAAIRDLDEGTYNEVVPKLAARQDQRDKRLVDKVKSELH